MLAIALLGFGALLLWAALTGRGDAIVNALQISLPRVQSGGGGGGGSDGGGDGGNAIVPNPPDTADSGTHQGMTASGDVYTIDKPYGDMTDSEKDDANRYAHGG